MNRILPPPPLRGRFVRRTAALWLLLRVVTVLGGAEILALYAELEGAPRPVGLPLGSLTVGAVLATITGGLILGDLARRGELLFLRNLGFSASRLFVASTGVCGVLEIAVQVARAW